MPLLPLQSTLPPLPPQSHPPPLCPPTTWHLFRFLPISWQTACISTQRAQCSDPHKSMADKSMLSLFSMPLLPLIFFCYFVVCQDLNFAQLNWVHFQTQIVTAWGFQLRQTLMLATDGVYRSFIYEMPHWNRSCSGFLLKLNLDLSVLHTLFQMRDARCLLWLSGLSFWPRANIYNTDKTNTFWSYSLRKKEVQFACK